MILEGKLNDKEFRTKFTDKLSTWIGKELDGIGVLLSYEFTFDPVIARLNCSKCTFPRWKLHIHATYNDFESLIYQRQSIKLSDTSLVIDDDIVLVVTND